ncbi:MAG TPA: ATP-binding protein [Gammaproteobacteria bacterium]|nr:ATP-binding protein [Gammaproteobacteria bacterium]
MSLRYRLLAVVLGVALATTLAATGATYYWARHEIDELLDYQLRQQALALRDKAYLLGNVAVVEPDPEQHVVIQLWDRRGVLRYLSHRAVDIARPERYGYANVSGSGEDWRVYATALGPWIVQLAQPLELRRAIAANAAWRMLLPLLAMLPLLSLAMWWIVGRVLAPITALAGSITTREHALEPIVADGLPVEVALTVHALNDLIARLKDVLARQQEFMADAAHELRTPLTAISLQAQLLERAASPAESAEALAELKRGIARSTHLVERLLTLARLDVASDREPTRVIDLGALVEASLVSARLLAQDRELALLAHVESAVQIEGSESPLQSLVDNLLDNALRYTPRGGRVCVELAARRQGAVLSVADSGPGVPEADRARIFDRFYRVPGTAVQGSGLGLAIVKRVADLHGAKIEVGESELGGARFTIHFPAAIDRSLG